MRLGRVRIPRIWQQVRATASAAGPDSFGPRLASRRLVLVAGGSTTGRAHVAAAAALCLAGKRQTLLVDANEPGHVLKDILGAQVSGDLPVNLVDKGDPKAPGGLCLAQLSGPRTREFLEGVLATDQWRRLIEDDKGMSFVESVGVPLHGLMRMLECIRPPPGAEMPIALARLLSSSSSAAEAQHVVVDAGAAATALQLQAVPPAVADGLEAVTHMTGLVRTARDSILPSALAAGFKALVGNDIREGASQTYESSMEKLEELQQATRALSTIESEVLLVLPHSPGRTGEAAARRQIERLRPACVALTRCEPGCTQRPDWLPEGPAVAFLPGVDGDPRGIDELKHFADAMSAQ